MICAGVRTAPLQPSVKSTVKESVTELPLVWDAVAVSSKEIVWPTKFKSDVSIVTTGDCGSKLKMLVSKVP